MLTWIGPILSSFLSGFTTTFVELYREWQRRNDIEELSKLKEMDRIRQTYVGEQRRLRSLGYDKILSEIHKEIGLDCTPAVMPAPGSDGDVFVVNRCVINDWLAARRALRGTAPELKDSPK